MSTSYSPTPNALRVEIRPSKYFRIALICIALVALGAIFYADLIWPLRLMLALFIAVYSGFCWRAQLRQRGVLQWRLMWGWHGVDGSERALRLRHSTVWPGLIVLTFCDIKSSDIERQQKFVLALFNDSFGADSFDTESARRLRVYLNHFPVFETGESVD